MFRNKDYILSVYKEGSISKAAQKLFISQPALSSAIKKVETNLGYPIFDRKTTPISLTEYGIKYIEAIRQIETIEEDLTQQLFQIDNYMIGDISIGTNHIFASTLFPRLLGLFQRQYPNIKVRLLEGAISTNEAALFNGTLDLVLDNLAEFKYPSEIERVPLVSETLLITGPAAQMRELVDPSKILSYQDIVANVHLDGNSPAVSPAIFAKKPFVLLIRGSDTRLRTDLMFQESEFPQNGILEVEQMATAYSIVKENQVFSVVSDTLIKNSAPARNIAFCKPDTIFAQRTIYFSYYKKRYIKAIIEEFLHFSLENKALWL